MRNVSLLIVSFLMVLGCEGNQHESQVRGAVGAALTSGDGVALRRAIEDFGDICTAVDIAQDELARRIGQAALAGNYSEAYVAHVRDVLRSFRELFGCPDPFHTPRSDGAVDGGSSSDGGQSDGGSASCESFSDCTSCAYQVGCAWYPAYGCYSDVYLMEHQGLTEPYQCGGAQDGGQSDSATSDGGVSDAAESSSGIYCDLVETIENPSCGTLGMAIPRVSGERISVTAAPGNGACFRGQSLVVGGTGTHCVPAGMALLFGPSVPGLLYQVDHVNGLTRASLGGRSRIGSGACGFLTLSCWGTESF